MKMAMTEKESSLIKMENGKQDLPIGISRSQYGSYRLQRTVNGVKYRFGSIQNLELALSVNAGIDELVKNFRIALEEPVSATAEQVTSIVEERSDSDMAELQHTFSAMASMIDNQNDFVRKELELLHNHISELANERKSFWKRLFKL